MTRLKTSVCILILTLFNGSTAHSQSKKPIQPEDYFKWKTIEQAQISDSGSIITHTQTVLRGNPVLVIQFKNDSLVKQFSRAKNAKIHPSEQFVVFTITPDYDSIRKLKLASVPEKKFPKDSLGIYFVSKDTVVKFPKVASFSIQKKVSATSNEWVALLRSDDFKLKPKAVPTATTAKKKCFLSKKEKKPEIKPTVKNVFKGSVLSLYNTKTNKSIDFEGVKEYLINETGDFCLFTVHKQFNDSIDSCFLFRFDFGDSKEKLVSAIKGEITGINWTNNAEKVTYVSSSDTGQNKNYQLYLWSANFSEPKIIVDTAASILKAHQSITKNSKPYFSENGTRLYFGVGGKVYNEPKDTVTKDEKAVVDIWHWNEGRIQPQQLKTLKKEKESTLNWSYGIDNARFVAISDTSIDDVRYAEPKNPDYALVSSQLPYLKEMTWDYWYYDYYLVDLNSGARKKLLTHYHGNSLVLAPSGNYIHYWNHADSSWILMNTKTETTLNLTKKLPQSFYRWHHDVGQKIDPEGQVYWIVKDSLFIIESQYDIWQFDVNGNAKNITNGKNVKNQFSVLKLDKESLYYNPSVDLFKSFNHKNKNEGLWSWDTGLVLLFEESKNLSSIQKALNSNDWIIRQSTVKEYPELQFASTSIANKKIITSTNPQQIDYNWATVELVSWKDYKGDSVSGLLYKPEDFDATKKYPMIVYYYERYTENLHRYYAPRPTASIVFPTEYSSNGYLIFIPDIKYEMGKPAQSAYNAIMSGTDYLTKKFSFVDSTKMGLQGQSWGGYQTAQLITMTTRYKCAMAGAPVSNMFSAYGGIRWGSGLSRTFQYETGQSRIGKTIWERPDLYIENSPLFHLPKVQTPLLIMHNDQDGAVPWYQGIELYVGLRRLEKPVWLLNYNGDDHNLMKPANRIDLSIRMKAFFDHYLMDAPAPEWLEKGIPAVDKGGAK